VIKNSRMKRFQKEQIIKDLEKKIVFIVGPRQVGKTWLAKDIAKSFTNPVYLNYDRLEDRQIIHNEAWLDSNDLLILDELHKMKNWKNFIKGVFDTKPEKQKILVTGSARLDTFRYSGDSLVGRFFLHRLLPFTPAEIYKIKEDIPLNTFLAKGCFPEPFLAEDITEVNRWRRQYINGLIRYDILDFERIQELKAIETIFELLRHRIGSPISFRSIAEDVGISSNTVKKYIQILEALFIIFRINPFSKNIARSLLKEPKLYFYDIGLVKGDEGIILENLVALSLMKKAFEIVDYTGKNTCLNYLRTKDGKEVDFCFVQDENIQYILEVKLSDSSISKPLKYFHEKYNLPAIQLVKNLKREHKKNSMNVLKADEFLKKL